MDDHRKLYRRIFSFERFIRNLTRSFSTMCDSSTVVGGPAAAAAAHAEQSGACGNAVTSASVLLAKRERRLRLEKVGSYRVGRTLGRGNFAHVRVAYHEVANAKVAMKIVDKRSLDEENLAKIEREIQILQQLNHPFIVRLHEVIRTERYLYIVTEYVSNGELFDMLMDRGRQTEAESRRLFQQIVSAVAYCHAHGIVHRDLKAENLLLDTRGNIKIIDFGFSNHHQPGQLLSTWCGSPPYAAPELLLAQEYDGRQSDVWSLGVILYILVTAGFPFPGDSVDKLKRAVLSDHLKIPFWVSVECSDLIRKMLTVQPAKRCTLHYVIQHKWMQCDMPDQIKHLLLLAAQNVPTSASSTTVHHQHKQQQQNHHVGRVQQQVDPTVLIFMQQHTGWSDEQIAEEVLGRNYESPVFGTYQLLLTRLSDIRNAEAVAAVATAICISNSGGSGNGSSTNLQLDSEYARRGSRGSIISGRAIVEPAEQQQHATIPAHHLAKLSLSTSPDYQDTDDSDNSASEWGVVAPSVSSSNDMPSSQFPAAAPSASATASAAAQRQTSYKSTRHRAYRRGARAAVAAQATVMAPTAELERHQQQQQQQQQSEQHQRMTYAALEQQYHQLNPLLNAAAQQFAVDTTLGLKRVKNTFYFQFFAAALFASQLQQQHSCSSDATRQQLQHAAALNLVSLQNFPFVDYAARMMHVPTQERRASANEALLGLDSYAHLLAACSTMGMGGGNGGGGGNGAATVVADGSAVDQQHTRCSSSQSTLSSNSPRQSSGAVVAQVLPAQQQHNHQQRNHHHHHRTSYHQQPCRSVEEEGEFYLSKQRGSGKRNTVHSITGGLSLVGTSAGGGGAANGASPQQSAVAVAAIRGAANVSQSLQSAFQRHTRTPYAKQGSSICSGVVTGGERRSSWASSSAGSAALAINAQQHAQLERLYCQSIGQANSSGASSESNGGGACMSSVQQLQHEFQKLCANTKEGSPTAGTAVASANACSSSNHNITSAFGDALNSANLLTDSTSMTTTTVSSADAAAAAPSVVQQMPRAPTISITDENNHQQSLLGSVLYDQQQQLLLSAILAQQNAAASGNMSSESQFSQSLPHQRPATVCGFTSSTGQQQQQQQHSVCSSPIDNSSSAPLSAASSQQQQQQQRPLKFVYIPVSIRTALERLQRVVDAHKLLCELQLDEPSMGPENVNAIRVRVAPLGEQPAQTTILELILFRMDQSPNISRASFTHVQGDTGEFEGLKQTLMSVFNEVLR
ncbi:hypothetical protein GPALN_014360 [Globodera pallida]|nr:hypothetical protein GPALN_014360 [Globodera pallida]